MAEIDETSSTPDAGGTGEAGSTSGAGMERTYTTKDGDTLEDVAAFFYGDPAQKQRLIDDNPDLTEEQQTAPLPAGIRLAVSEDAARGDALPSS